MLTIRMATDILYGVFILTFLIMKFSSRILTSLKLVVVSTFLLLSMPAAHSQVIISIFDIPGFANGGESSTDIGLLSGSEALNPVYPNTNGHADSDPVSVQIYDNNNNLIHTLSYPSSNEMMMPQLTAGLYRIVVYFEGTAYAKWVQVT